MRPKEINFEILLLFFTWRFKNLYIQ